MMLHDSVVCCKCRIMSFFCEYAFVSVLRSAARAGMRTRTDFHWLLHPALIIVYIISYNVIHYSHLKDHGKVMIRQLFVLLRVLLKILCTKFGVQTKPNKMVILLKKDVRMSLLNQSLLKFFLQ